MSNYPDDIRQYDHDPRSPFYDDSNDEGSEAYEERVEQEMQQYKDDINTVTEAISETFDEKDKELLFTDPEAYGKIQQGKVLEYIRRCAEMWMP